MIIVRFNSVDEFIGELAQSRPVGGVVRITKLFRRSSFSPAVQHVSVVATFLQDTPPIVQVVRLERYIGDLWGSPDQDQKVMDKTNEVVTKLERFVEGCELDWRPGIIEEEGGSKCARSLVAPVAANSGPTTSAENVSMSGASKSATCATATGAA
jgi:hypothetical protein